MSCNELFRYFFLKSFKCNKCFSQSDLNIQFLISAICRGENFMLWSHPHIFMYWFPKFDPFLFKGSILWIFEIWHLKWQRIGISEIMYCSPNESVWSGLNVNKNHISSHPIEDISQEGNLRTASLLAVHYYQLLVG